MIYFHFIVRIAWFSSLHFKKRLIRCFKKFGNIFTTFIKWWHYRILKDLSACKFLLAKKKNMLKKDFCQQISKKNSLIKEIFLTIDEIKKV